MTDGDKGLPVDDRVRDEVLRGLAGPRRSLPCKYFYDSEGSALFERICELEAYYLTRVEVAILERHAGEIAESLGPRCAVVELGSGAGVKTRLMFERLEAPVAYAPIDISPDPLRETVARMATLWPDVEMIPVHADFVAGLPDIRTRWRPDRRVVTFPGSTIGNFGPRAAVRLLRRVAAWCGPGGAFLLTADMKKDPRVLDRAYNDPGGVTAAFNLNILAHLNRRIGATFDVDAFQHHAFYDPGHGRIEMHLVARHDVRVRVAGVEITFETGESIRTEYSYKYSPGDLERLALDGGFDVVRTWTDDRGWVQILLLVAR